MGMTLTCWIVGWLLGGPEVRIATFQTEAMMEGMLAPARDTPLEGMLNWVAYAATGIELLAVVLIVGGDRLRHRIVFDENHGAASGHDHIHRLSAPCRPRFAAGP